MTTAPSGIGLRDAVLIMPETAHMREELVVDRTTDGR